MSAYNCSKEHYQYIADSFVTLLKTNLHYLDSYKYAFDLVGFDYKSRDEMTAEFIANQCIAELQGMNALAVAGRYNEDKLERPEIINANKNGNMNLNIIQLIKALNCTMYQCSEEPVYGTEKFIKWERFTHKLASVYVTYLEDYDKKAWEINKHN